MNKLWNFSNSARWYDIILGIKEYEKNAKFVSKQLQKYKAKTVLELACGSGLYLIPLKKDGFNIEGLDISKEMLDIAKKKSKSINLYQQDMTNFDTKKKYDTILILNSGLNLLSNHDLINKTIVQCNKHLNERGILLIDLPNLKKEIKEANHEQQHQEYKISNGKINLITLEYRLCPE